MNKKRRGKIGTQLQQLNHVVSALERIADEEGDALQNLPENLENSELAVSIEMAEDAIREAITHIESAVECLSNALS